MKTTLLLAAAALAFAACRKPAPKVEEKTDAAAPAPAPAAPQRVDANPVHGGDLIKKAQGAAATMNNDVKQGEKANDVGN